MCIDLDMSSCPCLSEKLQFKVVSFTGTPINKRPVLGYRNLNLFKLFRLVHKLGGFDNVSTINMGKKVLVN